MIKPSEPCPCGSGLLLNQCCLLDQLPISEKNQGYSRITINSQLVDDLGNEYIPLIGMKTNIELRKPQQLSSQITDLLNSVIPRITDISKFSNETGHIFQLLDDSLHAAQYHKRQFLYRLRLLTQEELLLYRPVKGNTIIELDDLPLRYEFEAFVSRIRVALDVLAKLVSSRIGKKNLTTNGKLYNYLKDNPQNKSILGLRELYIANEKWIEDLRKLRDSVQHDGLLPGFKSFQYEKGLVSYPKLNDLSANHVCFKMWGNLMQFIEEVLLVLFPQP